MAYTEDKAFDLIQSAHSRGRLGHAFIFSGTRKHMESLATRVINMINKVEPRMVKQRVLTAAPAPVTEEPKEDDGGADMFDLFGEMEPAPQETAAAETAEPEEIEVLDFKQGANLEELEGDLVRIISPHSKSRIIKVAEMRELEKSMYQSAKEGMWKVGVVKDADRMQAAAANAFLKTLEEPPNGCLLLLLTTCPERLLPTILSRCVNITIMSDEDEREALVGEQELLSTVIRVGRQGYNSIARAMTVKSKFSGLLLQRKTEITQQYEAAMKEENAHYKNATDGTWLKEREAHYLALTQSDYLLERSKYIDLLISFLGDLLRIKAGVDRLDFAQHEAAMREVAEKEDLEKLLLRMEALEKLRSMFETNVSEALALEVSFMNAFG